MEPSKPKVMSEQDIIVSAGSGMPGFEGIGEEEEFEVYGREGTAEENDFDMTVGILQDILIDEKWAELLDSFGKSNCMHFEAGEENKLIYTDIWKKYNEQCEKYLVARLVEQKPDFKMEAFAMQLEERREEIDEQIFDTLTSFFDFDAFKEMMLMHKAMLIATTPKLKSGKAAALGLKDSLGDSKAKSESQQKKEEELKYLEDNIDKLTITGATVRK